jgi:hypothetical protein
MAFVRISYLSHFCFQFDSLPCRLYGFCANLLPTSLLFQFDSLTLDMTKTQNSCLLTGGACANKSLSIKAWKYI